MDDRGCFWDQDVEVPRLTLKPVALLAFCTMHIFL